MNLICSTQNDVLELKPLIGGAWNKNVFGRAESNNKEALERIFHWARSDYSKSTRVKS